MKYTLKKAIDPAKKKRIQSIGVKKEAAKELIDQMNEQHLNDLFDFVHFGTKDNPHIYVQTKQDFK